MMNPEVTPPIEFCAVWTVDVLRKMLTDTDGDPKPLPVPRSPVPNLRASSTLSSLPYTNERGPWPEGEAISRTKVCHVMQEVGLPQLAPSWARPRSC